MDPKHKSDEALNVADFRIDDILNVPGDQLLAEVAEDFGDPAFLATQFDSTALPTVSSHNRSGVNRAEFDPARRDRGPRRNVGYP